MKIIVQKESDIPDLFKEAVHILAHLRYYTGEWERIHGAEMKERKRFWQERADELLSKLSAAPMSNSVSKVNIEIKENV